MEGFQLQNIAVLHKLYYLVKTSNRSVRYNVEVLSLSDQNTFPLAVYLGWHNGCHHRFHKFDILCLKQWEWEGTKVWPPGEKFGETLKTYPKASVKVLARSPRTSREKKSDPTVWWWIRPPFPPRNLLPLKFRGTLSAFTSLLVQSCKWENFIVT